METLESIAEVFGFGEKDAGRPARFAKVDSISGDTVDVLVGNGTSEAVRCCACEAGDVVLVVTLPSGRLAAVATKGASGGSTYVLPPATTTTLGGVMVDGTSITADADGVISGLYCTERSGGKTWAQCCTAPSPDGVGWREVKWSDGRLTVWFWDWWQINAASRTITWTWPSGPTAFIAAEPPFFATRPNGTASFVGINSTAQSTNSSLTCYIYKSGANCTCPIMVRIDGHWK